MTNPPRFWRGGILAMGLAILSVSLRLEAGEGRSSTSPSEAAAIRTRVVESRLIALLKHRDPRVRLRAAQALGNLRSRKAVPPLKPLLKDPNKPVRLAAAKALGLVGDHSGFRTAMESMKDPEHPTRIQAADALGAIGDPAAIPAVETLTHDPDGLVQSSARIALERLKASQGRKRDE